MFLGRGLRLLLSSLRLLLRSLLRPFRGPALVSLGLPLRRLSLTLLGCLRGALLSFGLPLLRFGLALRGFLRALIVIRWLGSGRRAVVVPLISVSRFFIRRECPGWGERIQR